MTTGYVTHELCMKHDMGAWHPESAARLAAINDQLLAAGVLVHLEACEAPEATRMQIERAHDAQYVDDLIAAVPQQGYAELDPDTVMNPHTWAAALRAAGAVVQATDQVMRQHWRNAFCAVRPPGHHAGRHQAMGFCFLNNVAIGVRHALHEHGLQRVAVFDFDVHHGNGTENILAGDERVLMTGFFQHPFYPYSGTGQTAKNMVNVPLPAGTGGEAMRQAVHDICLPRLEAFAPQMIFISAGFDAHREDDLGQMALVEADYAWMTQQLMRVADTHAQGRIVSALEGGYNLSALGRSVVAHVRTLAGI